MHDEATSAEILIDRRWHPTEQTTVDGDRVEIADSITRWLADIDAQRRHLWAELDSLDECYDMHPSERPDDLHETCSRMLACIESLDRLYTAGQRQLRSL